MSEWISVNDKLPFYGEPVIIVSNGVTQNITYIRDGSDECEDWFEPYHFDCDGELNVECHKVTHWMRLPEPPKGA